MTDSDITKLCAEALGYKVSPHPNAKFSKSLIWIANGYNWNPLAEDSQAMAIEYYLIENGNLHYEDGTHMFYTWPLSTGANKFSEYFNSKESHRIAICRCAASVQSSAK